MREVDIQPQSWAVNDEEAGLDEDEAGAFSFSYARV
jgi:hypothetical protein